MKKAAGRGAVSRTAPNSGETLKRLHAALLIIFSAATLQAAPVLPDSYSMSNGQAGNWIYQDNTYTNCLGNACNTSLANLSGGTGKLTDGIVTPDDWFGSGQPWRLSALGWLELVQSDYYILFQRPPEISRLGLYFDNTPGNGDVRIPESVDIAGVNYSVNADGQWGPRWVSFNIPTASFSSLDVTLHHVTGIPNSWIMLGEVSFNTEADAGAVPEPATVGLLGLGIIAIVARHYRSRS